MTDPNLEPTLYGEDDETLYEEYEEFDDEVVIADEPTGDDAEVCFVSEFDAYKIFLDKLPLPCAILDNKSYTIAFWNNASSRKFGITAEDAAGKPVTILFSDKMDMSEAEHDRRVATFADNKTNSGTSFGTARSVIGKDVSGRDIYFEIFTYKVILDGVEYVCGILCDITREKDLLKTVKAANEQLRKQKERDDKDFEKLAEQNQELFEARKAAEFRMARAKSQESITNKLLFIIAALLGATLIASIFIRVPETILSFLKDSSLLLLGILSGAIGGLFGREDKGGTGSVMNSATFKTGDGSIEERSTGSYDPYAMPAAPKRTKAPPAAPRPVEMEPYYEPEPEAEIDPRF